MTHSIGPLRRLEGGRFENLLHDEEKELLSVLPGLVNEAIDMNSPYVTRLFPPTYPFDTVAQAEFEKISSDALVKQHRGVLEGFCASIQKPEITLDDLMTWVGAINNIRLLLGTALDVYEEMQQPSEDDPRFQDFVIFDYLTWLQGSILEFLSPQNEPETSA